jgi:hypothetical protein
MAAEHYGVLRAVLFEHVEVYQAQVRRIGRDRAQQALIPTAEKLITDRPDVAARLLAAALDLLAEHGQEANDGAEPQR